MGHCFGEGPDRVFDSICAYFGDVQLVNRPGVHRSGCVCLCVCVCVCVSIPKTRFPRSIINVFDFEPIKILTAYMISAVSC